ncbi:MAG: hypothetical protein AAF721_12050 [Myxococcota bacterium]
MLGCASPGEDAADVGTTDPGTSAPADTGDPAESSSGAADPPSGSTTGHDAPGSTGSGESSGGGTWGEPVDCENHPVSGPSSLQIDGWMDAVEVELSCDFGGDLDYVHYCAGPAVGFLASCTTSEGVRVYLQVAPAAEGTYVEPDGDPRFAIQLSDGEQDYSLAAGNATEHSLSVDALDLDARRIRGSFRAAWFDMLLQGQHFPDGSIDGTFDIAF